VQRLPSACWPLRHRALRRHHHRHYAPAGTQAPNATVLCGSTQNADWRAELHSRFCSRRRRLSHAHIRGWIDRVDHGRILRQWDYMYSRRPIWRRRRTAIIRSCFPPTAEPIRSLWGDKRSTIPGVNYFGLWFSALDAGNELQFYENNTLLLTFTPVMFQMPGGRMPQLVQRLLRQSELEFSRQGFRRAVRLPQLL